MAPYATPILEHLVPVLQSPRGAVPSSLVDNSAITLGRVCTCHLLSSASSYITCRGESDAVHPVVTKKRLRLGARSAP